MSQTSEESSGGSARLPDSLPKKLTRLTRLIESGELASSLRTVAMVNPVLHAGRKLSPQEADVVVRVARSAWPMPLARLTRRDVACLPGLARSGFVIVERRGVLVTARGRALAVVRTRERAVHTAELGRVQASLAKLLRTMEAAFAPRG